MKNKKKNSWTTLNFIYFEGKNVFLLWKKKDLGNQK
jgi:hypothetical protein